MTTDYCTADELKDELGIGIGDMADDSKLATSITAASRQIDGWCGRRFWIDAAATTRDFYTDDVSFVDLAGMDIATTVGLLVKTDTEGTGTYATTLTLGTDFLLLKPNAAADGEGFEALEAIGDGYFPQGRRPGVRITAKFGFPSVPVDVKKACLIQAAQLYKSKDAVFGAIALGDSQAMRIGSSLNPTARGLLARYQRVPIG